VNGDLTAVDLAALGVYEPAADDAPDRLELLQFLVSLGATSEDLVAYRDELPGLASVLAIRGGARLTLQEAAQRSGVPADKLRRINRIAGFPDPGPEDRVFGENFVGVAAGMIAAESLFGEEAVLQLLRVMGSATARVADALVSAFLVNVEPAARGEDHVGLGVARANAEAARRVRTGRQLGGPRREAGRPIRSCCQLGGRSNRRPSKRSARLTATQRLRQRGSAVPAARRSGLAHRASHKRGER
jgi:hypothetical protein